MRAGTARAIATVPAMQSSPPETIEKRRLVSEARTPASTLPSAGVEATCANSIPESLPRSESGVTVHKIVPRRTALTLSAAPAAARNSKASQRDSAKPKATIAAPQSDAATATISPCLRTCPIQPERSDATRAPAYGDAYITPSVPAPPWNRLRASAGKRARGIPKTIAFESTRNIPSSTFLPRAKRKPSAIERRLGRSASCAGGGGGRRQTDQSEPANVAAAGR